MSKNEKNSNINSIIDATTGLVKAIPVYDDLVQPAAKELGTALATVAKTVNVALAPISGIIWGYDTIKDFVASKVSQKLINIAPENIATPNPIVVGPALEALKYTGHNEILRNMYANLLANALDKATKDDTHPSFVELIKQLSPREAQLLLEISQRDVFPNVCYYQGRERTFDSRHSIRGGIVSNKVKSEFVRLCDKIGIELDAEVALDNYRRLQVVDIESTTSYAIRDSILRGSFEISISSNLALESKVVEKLYFTQYGVNFINTCVKNKN